MEWYLPCYCILFKRFPLGWSRTGRAKWENFGDIPWDSLSTHERDQWDRTLELCKEWSPLPLSNLKKGNLRWKCKNKRCSCVEGNFQRQPPQLSYWKETETVNLLKRSPVCPSETLSFAEKVRIKWQPEANQPNKLKGFLNSCGLKLREKEEWGKNVS